MKDFKPVWDRVKDENPTKAEEYEARRDFYKDIAMSIYKIRHELKDIRKSIEKKQNNGYNVAGDYVPVEPSFGDSYQLYYDTSHLDQIDDIAFIERQLSRMEDDIMKKYGLTFGSQLYSLVCPDIDD